MELVVLALGALLLLTGIVGGGFELREIKIPQVGRVARVLSTTAGVALILMGIGMVTTSTANPTETQATPVTFKVFDQLGEGQLSEQVTVLLDGKRVGHLTVSAAFPYSEMTVTVPEAGRYSYTVEAMDYFIDGETGETFSRAGAGQGMIQVSEGSVFGLAGSISGNSWVVTLAEYQAAPSTG